ncbi:hypothetical protein [Streptomyces sp. NPDC101178]|uniref:hypothetical protein n=1 Tax=Streptomyces sp. NPDC101178 TaxID=3366124 RepID=UPI0038198BEA
MTAAVASVALVGGSYALPGRPGRFICPSPSRFFSNSVTACAPGANSVDSAKRAITAIGQP